MRRLLLLAFALLALCASVVQASGFRGRGFNRGGVVVHRQRFVHRQGAIGPRGQVLQGNFARGQFRGQFGHGHR